MKMWGGRFIKDTNPGFHEFSSSLDFDVRLYPYDVAVTKAWAGALRGAAVLTPDEERGIAGALEGIDRELDAGEFSFSPDDEDIHTAVERRLTEVVGPYGGKVRAGRSRNDQVATDMRLLVMDECDRLTGLLRSLQLALLERARETAGLVVPGHTHLQQAQPLPMAHLLLAFLQMLGRDRERMAGARRAADSMPLGSGAIAGTGFEIDREALAEALGFSKASANSVDATSDRDFICDALFATAMVMLHLSRLAEQVVLWCSQEFGLVELDDSWATGSSIMPQKKNPDGPELVRGKTGRVVGDLMGMLTVIKGLPLAYNRDLQEDKESLFDAIDTTAGCLFVMERTIATMSFNAERARELAGSGFITATDLADYLTEKGVPFPEAHRIAGEVVAYCLETGKALEELSPDDLARFSEKLDEGALHASSIEASLERRASLGGTSRAAIERQIADAERAV